MISHRWTGTNGEVFDLTSGSVQLVNNGVEGLGHGKEDAYTRATPALDGQRLTGSRLLPRDVFWTVLINGGPDWFDVQSLFWGSLRPNEYGVWRVTAPDGSYRELTCRHTPSSYVYQSDPSFSGSEEHGISLVADDPWWKGPEVSDQFQPVGDVLPFFAVTTDRVFNLMSSNTVASATVDNPGDVDAWPKYTITGPVSAFSATISGGVVSSVADVVAGAVLVIDTDPTVQRAILTVAGVDTNVTRDLVEVDWRPVPAGGSVSLDVTLAGTGSLMVSLIPRFYRAW